MTELNKNITIVGQHKRNVWKRNEWKKGRKEEEERQIFMLKRAENIKRVINAVVQSLVNVNVYS